MKNLVINLKKNVKRYLMMFLAAVMLCSTSMAATTIASPVTAQAATMSTTSAKWQKAVKAYNKHLKAKSHSSYTIDDVDENGVPELMVREGASLCVYTYTTKVTKIKSMVISNGGIYYSKKSHKIFFLYTYRSCCDAWVYELSGTKMSNETQYSIFELYGNHKYYKNNKQISAAKSKKIWNQLFNQYTAAAYV